MGDDKGGFGEEVEISHMVRVSMGTHTVFYVLR